MLRLTGLDMQENQARRLLNDIDSFRLIGGFGDEKAAAALGAQVYDRCFAASLRLGLATG